MKNKGLVKLILTAFIVFGAFGLGTITSEAAGWKQYEGDNWGYQKDDGSWYKSEWFYDGSYWYYFDADGWMVKGLQTIGEHEYYFNEKTHGSWPTGCMMWGWQYLNGQFKYFSQQGSGIYRPDISAGENVIKGIDVSQFQGNMDWGKVKNQGFEFAFIRVGHGEHNLDPYFQTNITNANNAGLKTGVYFYSTAQSVEASRGDALWVIEQLKGYNVSYPVAIDLESSSQIDLGWQTITDIAKAFCDEIRAAGYTPMVYCNENWATNYVDFPQLDGVYKWIARYAGAPSSNISRDIWQAGSTAFIDGIDVNSVDVDFGYTDFSQITTPRTERIYDASGNEAEEVGGQWMNSSGGWWYQRQDGTYPVSTMSKINGTWYYFNSQGYLHTGWLGSGNEWRYFTTNGMMASSWIQSSGVWYYMNSNGLMACNEWSGGYWLGGSGAWTYGGIGKWYRNDIGWWYQDSYGWYPTNSWQKIDEKWYYFDANGYMVTNTTIGGYVIDENGVWDPDKQQ